MAVRPVYIPIYEGSTFVKTQHVEFKWFPGMSVSQKQKSIQSLHEAAVKTYRIQNVLEISSKSEIALGVALSAFNLMINTVKYNKTYSVESAFQSSKVFENGGPFIDLLEKTSREAKNDPRLKTSGRLKHFRFCGVDWGLEPQTAFYDWLYICALSKYPEFTDEIQKYSGFTDIEFNPERSINCQAYSAALFLSLSHRCLLADAISSKDAFINIVSKTIINNAKQDENVQGSLKL